MHPLLLRLASLRRRLWMVNGWRGLCAVGALLVGAAVVVGVIDYGVHLPNLVRALALVGLLAGAGVVVYRYLLEPFRTPSDDLALALRVEAHFPQLNDALASAVQFLEYEDTPNAPGSVSMRKKAIAQTENLADECEFGAIVNGRGVLLLTAGAILAVLAAGYFLLKEPQLSSIALARLADPFGNHPWTQIDVEGCPHKVAVGQPYDVKAHFEGVVPVNAIVEIESLGATPKRNEVVKRDADGKGSLHTRLDMTQHRGKFKFRIVANDGVYPPGRNAWHAVEVLPPPRLVDLAGKPSPQIELFYPGYTDLASPVQLAAGTWAINAPAGTRVTFRAATDREIDKAWIEFSADKYFEPLSAYLAPLAATGTWDVLGGLMGGQAIWGRFPAVLGADGKTFSIDFYPQVNGYYVLHIEDADGLAKEERGDLRVVADPLPTVQLLRPGTSMSVLPDAEIGFHVVVEDEQYAIRSVYVEYRRRDLEAKWIDEHPKRLEMYGDQLTSRLLTGIGSAVGRFPDLAQDLRLRPKRLELKGRWPLKNRFDKGEIIVLQVCADDFCDLYLSRQAGRSHEVEIRIVGNEELAKILDDGLADAQKDLARVQQLQEEALNLAREIQKKQDKAGQKELDQLIEAGELQKQVIERVGKTADEGLRKQLAKLNQLIKDNKLPPSDVQEHIKTMKQELERLSQEDLQQIEPNLAEMRKDLLTPKDEPKTDPKTDPKAEPKQSPKANKTPLDKAVSLQKDVKKSLDEMAKFLDPWATTQQIKAKTREILDRQKLLQKETNDIRDNLDPDKFDPKQAEARKEADKISEAQNGLAQKTQELIDTMAKAQVKRAEQGDKDAANKLKEAGKIAKDARLPEKMREAANDLKEQRPKMASQAQQENVKKLEKVLAALEEGKTDDELRLKKKQKKAQDVQDKLDNIAAAQEKLTKKVKEANKIEDPEARKAELKRLGEEQQKIKEEAKENARELSRLNEERASQELNRAAQEMANAAEKLAEGENPEQDQKEALNRLEEAQNKLQNFQEELAREQLAKIEDRLKGLKERQDAALARSSELHKKVVRANQWTAGLLPTLKGDQDSQEGLAKEADSLREKIKEAKVFEHILAKAAKSMEDAAKVMGQRRDEARDRIKDFDKEELADENKRDEDTRKLQSQASQRLQRLLDALKNEPPKVARKPKKADNDPKAAKEPEQPQNGIRPADGIPPMAQLKALRAEQLDVNERTKDFAQRHPDGNILNEAQRAELAAIQADQEKIRQLFGDMTAEKKGEQP